MTFLWPGDGGPKISYISRPPARLSFPRKISVLGSSGSIGRNTLSVARSKPASLQIVALAGFANHELAARQAAEFRPARIAMRDRELCEKVGDKLDYSPQFSSGPRGYAELAACPEADAVVLAQSGAAGIYGALAACLAGKFVILANKESLVMAGPLLRAICEKSGAAILPADSEHNAVFQCIAGRGQNVKKLILTASGGPFRGKKAAELEKVGPADALRHPNWKMGAKISVDSSTLMNKALELIEAAQLFGINPDDIEILIQPQSIIHSMAEMADHSILAQLGAPDMRLPLAFCLLWPKVEACDVKTPDFAALGRLDFARPDEEVFTALALGRHALARSSLNELSAACIALNAANEICVELFLKEKIAWPKISAFTAQALERFADAPLPMPSLPRELPQAPHEIADLALTLAEPLMKLDAEVRAWVAERIAQEDSVH